MKVMIVGNGGREHTLAWSVARSTSVEAVLVAPGNPGTLGEGGIIENVPVDATDFDGLADIAQRQGIDLTIVGPEAPLAAGIRDLFDARGLPCFGPSQAAAQLESSKSFAKGFMARHGIPTARHAMFTDADAAEAYIRAQACPIVVKADGLAAGKGVVIAHSHDDATQASREMLSGRFGSAGQQLVIEDFLVGEEASFTCLVDGQNALPLASSQDHKARDDGDRGPNTGGMGAYSPAPVVTQAVHDRVMAEIVQPTVRGMAEEGTPYQGFLYVGLMISPDGAPKVVEFNCRFGDPEAQPVLMRLHTDLAALCQQALAGDLSSATLEWDPRHALGVVLASPGYPDAPRTGEPIHGLDYESRNAKVFHAGTKMVNGQVVTSGGRVVTVVGLGTDLAKAQAAAYARAERISWRGIHYRRDIGYRALN